MKIKELLYKWMTDANFTNLTFKFSEPNWMLQKERFKGLCIWKIRHMVRQMLLFMRQTT
jgi:hypothetical protein